MCTLQLWCAMCNTILSRGHNVAEQCTMYDVRSTRYNIHSIQCSDFSIQRNYSTDFNNSWIHIMHIFAVIHSYKQRKCHTAYNLTVKIFSNRQNSMLTSIRLVGATKALAVWRIESLYCIFAFTIFSHLKSRTQKTAQ